MNPPLSLPLLAPLLSRDWTNEGMEGWRAEWVCRDACLHLSAPLKKGCSGGVKSQRVSGGAFMRVEERRRKGKNQGSGGGEEKEREG